MRRGRAGLLAAAALAAALAAATAAARTLQVGPGQAYDRPSGAARDARDGDTVLIAPGDYFDCARFTADRLTIAGAPGGEATLTDQACDGKAALVLSGNGITIRHLGFARIRVPDDNGAGIRADGADLTVEDSRFDNTQIGILARSAAGGTLRVIGCRFRAIGATQGGRVNTAIHADGFAQVRIEASDVSDARAGAAMFLRAGAVELVGNRLSDTGGAMQGPLVLVDSARLRLEDNQVTLGAAAAARPGVVLATADASGDATGAADTIIVRGNLLREAGAGGVPLLRNWTGRPAVAEANSVPPGSEAVSTQGFAYHRLRASAAELRARLQALWQAARHVGGLLLRRFG